MRAISTGRTSGRSLSPEPVTGRATRVGAVQPSGRRGTARRRADRNIRLRERRTTARPDERATRRTRQHRSSSRANAPAALFETGSETSRLHARTGLCPGCGRAARRFLCRAGPWPCPASIAALQETSIAPSVRRAAEDLSIGFIAPVADGSSAELVSRQGQGDDNGARRRRRPKRRAGAGGGRDPRRTEGRKPPLRAAVERRGGHPLCR